MYVKFKYAWNYTQLCIQKITSTKYFFGRELNLIQPPILTILISLMPKLAVVILLLTINSKLYGCLAHLIMFSSAKFRRL
jgi:hypothetical protein